MRSKFILTSLRVWSRKFILRLFMCCFFAGTLAGCEGTDANSNVQNKAQLESRDSAELWISNKSGREVDSSEDVYQSYKIDWDKLEIDSDSVIKSGGKEIKYVRYPPEIYLLRDRESLLRDRESAARKSALEDKILKRYGGRGAHEIDETDKFTIDGPSEHQRLAKIYFAERNMEAYYRQLEFVALFHESAGRKLSKYYEKKENYRKAYFYYAYAIAKSEKKYNAEKFKALYPTISRLHPYLNETDHKWVESEMLRHVLVRRKWARKLVDEAE